MPNLDLNLKVFCAISGKTWHDMVADFNKLNIYYDSFNPIRDPMEVIIHNPHRDIVKILQSLGWEVVIMTETIAARQMREVKASAVVA